MPALDHVEEAYLRALRAMQRERRVTLAVFAFLLLLGLAALTVLPADAP